MAHILLFAAEHFTAGDWSRALTESGHTPRVAANATAALAWLEAFQFDLVLVEHAPERGLDGLAFALQARALPRQSSVPLVLLAEAGEKIALEVMLAAGVDGVLGAPGVGRGAELLDGVEPFLRQGRSASGVWAALALKRAGG